MADSNLSTNQKYFSVRQFSERHGISEGAIRNILFFKNENGFKSCVRKVGKRVYISEDEYFKWMEANRYAS